MPADLASHAHFDAIKDADEQILWSGRPHPVLFLMTGVPFLVFGCFWGAFDYFIFIRQMASMPGAVKLGAAAFFAIHLFPFWGSILNMFRLMLVQNNTWYGFSNRRMFLRSGFFGNDFKTVDLASVAELEVNVNPFENMCGRGSIRAFSGHIGHKGRKHYDKFFAVQDPYEVYKQLTQLQAAASKRA